jgi:hypothetical protein
LGYYQKPSQLKLKLADDDDDDVDFVKLKKLKTKNTKSNSENQSFNSIKINEKEIASYVYYTIDSNPILYEHISSLVTNNWLHRSVSLINLNFVLKPAY